MIRFTAINKQNAAIRADGTGKVQPSGHGHMPQYSTVYHTCSWPRKFTRRLFLRKCLSLCCWGLAALIYWIIALLAKATTLLNLGSEAMCPGVRIFEKNLVSHKLLWLTKVSKMARTLEVLIFSAPGDTHKAARLQCHLLFVYWHVLIESTIRQRSCEGYTYNTLCTK